jgi:hypothetical protein
VKSLKLGVYVRDIYFQFIYSWAIIITKEAEMKLGALIFFGSFYTTMCGNLVSLGASPQPYQQIINGINYGSNAAACYSTCYRG